MHGPFAIDMIKATLTLSDCGLVLFHQRVGFRRFVTELTNGAAAHSYAGDIITGGSKIAVMALYDNAFILRLLNASHKLKPLGWNGRHKSLKIRITDSIRSYSLRPPDADRQIPRIYEHIYA